MRQLAMHLLSRSILRHSAGKPRPTLILYSSPPLRQSCAALSGARDEAFLPASIRTDLARYTSFQSALLPSLARKSNLGTPALSPTTTNGSVEASGAAEADSRAMKRQGFHAIVRWCVLHTEYNRAQQARMQTRHNQRRVPEGDEPSRKSDREVVHTLVYGSSSDKNSSCTRTEHDEPNISPSLHTDNCSSAQVGLVGPSTTESELHELDAHALNWLQSVLPHLSCGQCLVLTGLLCDVVHSVAQVSPAKMSESRTNKESSGDERDTHAFLGIKSKLDMTGSIADSLRSSPLIQSDALNAQDGIARTQTSPRSTSDEPDGTTQAAAIAAVAHAHHPPGTPDDTDDFCTRACAVIAALMHRATSGPTLETQTLPALMSAWYGLYRVTHMANMPLSRTALSVLNPPVALCYAVIHGILFKSSLEQCIASHRAVAIEVMLTFLLVMNAAKRKELLADECHTGMQRFYKRLMEELKRVYDLQQRIRERDVEGQSSVQHTQSKKQQRSSTSNRAVSRVTAVVPGTDTAQRTMPRCIQLNDGAGQAALRSHLSPWECQRILRNIPRSFSELRLAVLRHLILVSQSVHTLSPDMVKQLPSLFAFVGSDVVGSRALLERMQGCAPHMDERTRVRLQLYAPQTRNRTSEYGRRVVTSKEMNLLDMSDLYWICATHQFTITSEAYCAAMDKIARYQRRCVTPLIASSPHETDTAHLGPSVYAASSTMATTTKAAVAVQKDVKRTTRCPNDERLLQLCVFVVSLLNSMAHQLIHLDVVVRQKHTVTVRRRSTAADCGEATDYDSLLAALTACMRKIDFSSGVVLPRRIHPSVQKWMDQWFHDQVMQSHELGGPRIDRDIATIQQHERQQQQRSHSVEDEGSETLPACADTDAPIMTLSPEMHRLYYQFFSYHALYLYENYHKRFRHGAIKDYADTDHSKLKAGDADKFVPPLDDDILMQKYVQPALQHEFVSRQAGMYMYFSVINLMRDTRHRRRLVELLESYNDGSSLASLYRELFYLAPLAVKFDVKLPQLRRRLLNQRSLHPNRFEHYISGDFYRKNPFSLYTRIVYNAVSFLLMYIQSESTSAQNATEYRESVHKCKSWLKWYLHDCCTPGNEPNSSSAAGTTNNSSTSSLPDTRSSSMPDAPTSADECALLCDGGETVTRSTAEGDEDEDEDEQKVDTNTNVNNTIDTLHSAANTVSPCRTDSAHDIDLDSDVGDVIAAHCIHNKNINEESAHRNSDNTDNISALRVTCTPTCTSAAAASSSVTNVCMSFYSSYEPPRLRATLRDLDKILTLVVRTHMFLCRDWMNTIASFMMYEFRTCLLLSHSTKNDGVATGVSVRKHGDGMNHLYDTVLTSMTDGWTPEARDSTSAAATKSSDGSAAAAAAAGGEDSTPTDTDTREDVSATRGHCVHGQSQTPRHEEMEHRMRTETLRPSSPVPATRWTFTWSSFHDFPRPAHIVLLVRHGGANDWLRQLIQIDGYLPYLLITCDIHIYVYVLHALEKSLAAALMERSNVLGRPYALFECTTSSAASSSSRNAHVLTENSEWYHFCAMALQIFLSKLTPQPPATAAEFSDSNSTSGSASESQGKAMFRAASSTSLMLSQWAQFDVDDTTDACSEAPIDDCLAAQDEELPMPSSSSSSSPFMTHPYVYIGDRKARNLASRVIIVLSSFLSSYTTAPDHTSTAVDNNSSSADTIGTSKTTRTPDHFGYPCRATKSDAVALEKLAETTSHLSRQTTTMSSSQLRPTDMLCTDRTVTSTTGCTQAAVPAAQRMDSLVARVIRQYILTIGVTEQTMQRFVVRCLPAIQRHFPHAAAEVIRRAGRYLPQFNPRQLLQLACVCPEMGDAVMAQLQQLRSNRASSSLTRGLHETVALDEFCSMATQLPPKITNFFAEVFAPCLDLAQRARLLHILLSPPRCMAELPTEILAQLLAVRATASRASETDRAAMLSLLQPFCSADPVVCDRCANSKRHDIRRHDHTLNDKSCVRETATSPMLDTDVAHRQQLVDAFCDALLNVEAIVDEASLRQSLRRYYPYLHASGKRLLIDRANALLTDMLNKKKHIQQQPLVSSRCGGDDDPTEMLHLLNTLCSYGLYDEATTQRVCRDVLDGESLLTQVHPSHVHLALLRGYGDGWMLHAHSMRVECRSDDNMDRDNTRAPSSSDVGDSAGSKYSHGSGSSPHSRRHHTISPDTQQRCASAVCRGNGIISDETVFNPAVCAIEDSHNTETSAPHHDSHADKDAPSDVPRGEDGMYGLYCLQRRCRSASTQLALLTVLLGCHDEIAHSISSRLSAHAAPAHTMNKEQRGDELAHVPSSAPFAACVVRFQVSLAQQLLRNSAALSASEFAQLLHAVHCLKQQNPSLASMQPRTHPRCLSSIATVSCSTRGATNDENSRTDENDGTSVNRRGADTENAKETSRGCDTNLTPSHEAFRSVYDKADAHSRCTIIRALCMDAATFAEHGLHAVQHIIASIPVLSSDDIEVLLHALLNLRHTTRVVESVLDAIGSRLQGMLLQCRRSTLVCLLRCHGTFDLRDDALLGSVIDALSAQCAAEVKLDTAQILTVLQTTADFELTVPPRLLMGCFERLERDVDELSHTRLALSGRLAVRHEMGYCEPVRTIVLRIIGNRAGCQASSAFRAVAELLCEVYDVHVPPHLRMVRLRSRPHDKRLLLSSFD